MAKRWQIYGRVQGVGFRYFTWHKAQQLGLLGYVHNCQDGSVEVVAQGSLDALEAFHNWLQQGPRSARVDRVLEKNIAEQVFQAFEIRH